MWFVTLCYTFALLSFYDFVPISLLDSGYGQLTRWANGQRKLMKKLVLSRLMHSKLFLIDLTL